MIWGLSLLCFAVCFKAVDAGPIPKPAKIEVKAAPQEEVNVLMFGVIQFSESLSYAFESTEAKIGKIIKKLRNHERSLQQLGQQTEQAAEVERQIKDMIQTIQEQMAKQQAQTKMTKNWLALMEQEEEELRSKVKRLETFLNNSLPTSIKELQERANEHSSILKGLQLLTRVQKESIESQNEQLLKLQNMSETLS